MQPRTDEVNPDMECASGPQGPLNICMVSDDFIPNKTGVGVHVKHISKELAARGHNVVVITTRRRGEPKFETWQGVKVYRLFIIKAHGYYLLGVPWLPGLRKILKRHQIDILHYQYMGLFLLATTSLAKSVNAKKVYTYHMRVEHIIEDSKLMHRLAPWISKKIINFCNSCDLVTVPSQGYANQIQSDGVVIPVRYVSSAAGIEDFAVPAHKPAKKGDRFVVLFVGRFKPEKNVSCLIDAFKLLLDRCESKDRCELWLVGDGSKRGELEAQCARLGIESYVKFWGQVDHVRTAEFYCDADVFALPSLIEVQGSAAIEAIHFGLPVIVTRAIPAASELVEDGVTGYIIDPGSSQHLMGKLEILMNDPMQREAMGAEGQSRCVEFTTRSVTDRHEQFYRDLFESPDVAYKGENQHSTAGQIDTRPIAAVQ